MAYLRKIYIPTQLFKSDDVSETAQQLSQWSRSSWLVYKSKQQKSKESTLKDQPFTLWWCKLFLNMHPVTSQYDGRYNIVNTNCYYLAPSLRTEVPGGGESRTHSSISEKLQQLNYLRPWLLLLLRQLLLSKVMKGASLSVLVFISAKASFLARLCIFNQATGYFH